MKNTVKITARAKASLLMIAGDTVKAGLTKSEAIKVICRSMIKKGMVESGGEYNAMLAVALAFYEYKKAQFDGKRPLECLREYAVFKWMCAEKLSDYGAFGDIVETALRCSVKPDALVQWNDLHVARQSHTDLTLRGVKCEIGTNGKSFSDTEENKPFADYYDLIVYGVFSDTEKRDLFTLLQAGKYDIAFKNLQEMLYVFTKEQFYHCMTEKTGRASMYQFKPTAGYWQVIYNPSKYTAFLHMVENENVPTVKQWLASR